MSTTDAADSTTQEPLAELKEKNQWVCWKLEERDGKPTKIPVNPHTGSYASSTDPDTWSDYETAQTHHNTNPETEGIGIVFGPDDLLAGVDLDNVYNPETEELEDWAEDVINTLGSYAEWSPSGTGAHVLLYGILPEDGRTRAKQESTLDAYDESEIEAYDNGRFFTVTEDHIEGTPTSLKQRNNELREVHEEYLARDDTGETAETTTEPTEANLDLSDQELIEKAKNAENGREFERLWNGDTSGHDGDHSRADMALLSHLAFWTGCDRSRMERLFDQSGLTRDKWNEREDYRERSIKKAIRGCSDTYDPDQESDDGDEEGDWTHVGQGVWEDSRGRYGVKRRTQDGTFVELVTSYALETNAILIDPVTGEKQLDLTVIPAADVEDEYDVVVEPAVFNELRKFKSEIQTGTTTTWSGETNDLNKIRKHVAHQDAPIRVPTTKIGLHGDELVTPDGVYTAEGDAEHRYVPTGNAIDSKWALDDIGDYDEDTVQAILELLPETRDSERFLPILGWMYASLYTPYIREWADEVPLCGVDADTGAGKTSILGYLTAGLGLDGTPLSAQDTKFSLIKHLSAASSIPIWLDEYKPSDMQDYKLDGMQDLLRKTTRGGDETRGNADKTQERYTLEAPVILSGEQAIQGAAEQRRMIRTQLKKSATEAGSDTARAWAKLNGGSYETATGVEYCGGYDPAEHAAAIHEWVLDTDIEAFADSWQTCQTHIYDLLSEHNISQINGIELTALTMVKWGIAVYQKFAAEIGADPDITDNEVENALLYLAGQMGEENRVSHVEEFLALCSDAAREHNIRAEQDFAVVNEGKENEQLLLKLRSAHQKVTSMVNNNGLEGYDLLNSANDYRKRLSDDADADDLVVDMSKYHADINRAVALDMDALEERVPNFEASNFYQ